MGNSEISTGASLVFNTIIAMFVLAFSVGMITLSNGMWRLVEKEDIAQTRTLAYSEISSFDNRYVTGQDLVNIITKYQGQVPVGIGTNLTTNASFVIGYDPNHYNDVLDTTCFATEGRAAVLAGGALPNYKTTNSLLHTCVTTTGYYPTIGETIPGTANKLTISDVQKKIKDMRNSILSPSVPSVYGVWAARIYFRDEEHTEPAYVMAVPVADTTKVGGYVE